MAKICIDPGHYGKANRSPGIPEYYESETVWKLAQMQKKYLEQLGHTVVMTRTNQNKDLALQSRGKASKGCDLFISDHTNAVGSGMNESVSYASIIPMVGDTTTKCDDIAMDFAKKIGPVIANAMGITYKISTKNAQSDRNGDGIKNDNYYGVLHGARLVNTPGIILEHGFHTHSATVRWLLNDANLDRLAKAEAECINAYFKPQNEPNTKPQTYYTVVKGDTLSKIGKKFGVSWKTIADLNGIKSPYTIYPGQKIRIS